MNKTPKGKNTKPKSATAKTAGNKNKRTAHLPVCKCGSKIFQFHAGVNFMFEVKDDPELDGDGHLGSMAEIKELFTVGEEDIYYVYCSGCLAKVQDLEKFPEDVYFKSYVKADIMESLSIFMAIKESKSGDGSS